MADDKRQKLGLPAQLLQAGTAACIADLITFPLDTTKVFEIDQKLYWTLFTRCVCKYLWKGQLLEEMEAFSQILPR